MLLELEVSGFKLSFEFKYENIWWLNNFLPKSISQVPYHFHSMIQPSSGPFFSLKSPSFSFLIVLITYFHFSLSPLCLMWLYKCLYIITQKHQHVSSYLNAVLPFMFSMKHSRYCSMSKNKPQYTPSSFCFSAPYN